MKNWTSEANKAINVCEKWASTVLEKIEGTIYLFGSVIYKDGEQFNSENSDLDLIFLFKKDTDALERSKVIKKLYKRKKELELAIIPSLHRKNCTEPGVSIVPITNFELHANIHKSGARNFFDKNFFYDLGSKNQSLGIPQAGKIAVKDEKRQALEYVQKIRNQYLSVGANGIGGIKEFNDSDPTPKALLRSAAQLIPNSVEGEWYDTRLGLEFIHKILTEKKEHHNSNKLNNLLNKISVRRGGRGIVSSLTAYDQLLLTELLFDEVSSSPADFMLIWKVRISGSIAIKNNTMLLKNIFMQIAPEASIIGTSFGSIIFTIKSPKKTFEYVRKLSEDGFLHKIMMADSTEVSELSDKNHDINFTPKETRLSKLIDSIEKWRPSSNGGHNEIEEEFYEFLKDTSSTISGIDSAKITRNINFEPIENSQKFDFLLSWPISEENEDKIVIEVSRFKSAAGFFQKIAKLIQINHPLIFVIIGGRVLLEKIRGDIERLSILNSNIKIAKIPMEDARFSRKNSDVTENNIEILTCSEEKITNNQNNIKAD